MKVYLGWDSREAPAYGVAAKTLYNTSGIVPTPLKADRLAAAGLYSRPVDMGRGYDLPSNAPCSTEFAASRFLTPILAQTGWALFADCDVVFLRDVAEMLTGLEPGKAVYVVKHQQKGGGTKMDGQAQTSYSRKNWSSVMLFDCNHEANWRLSVEDVSRRPGRDLHGFFWLHDDEIGELGPEWNWLVNVVPKPNNLGIAHFTLGGPWFPDWQGAEHDDLWLSHV
jgi:hypothetical protein